MANRPRVVIAGAGFGGLWAARALGKAPAEVLVIDRNNYHAFLPLLYQVAAAELSPEEIVYPIRSILRQLPNVDFALGEVVRIDFRARTVHTQQTAIAYDFLLLAVGSQTHFFAVPGAAEYAYPLKTLDHAIRLRNHILACFERAVHEPDQERRPAPHGTGRRRRLLTFVIVGGGPTGVEFAGALAELLRHPVLKDYPTFDSSQMRVVLVEALDGLLPGLPDRLRDYALARLRRMGVDVRLRAVVSEVTAEAVRLEGGAELPANTVVWTAGVRGEPAVGTWGLPTERSGRVKTLPTLQVVGYPEVYVAGDLAHFDQEGRNLPMIAPVAIQQGRAAAANIHRQILGQAPLPFRYRDRGTMATIGRNAAVAYLSGHAFTGFPAWLIWLGVHLFNLIGYRNRMVVMIDWAWDYFLFERTVRLILPSSL